MLIAQRPTLTEEPVSDNLRTGRIRMVFVARGSLQLWAGVRPKLFRRLLERGQLKFNFRTLSALVWTIWATLSPNSLRAFLSTILNFRNRAAEAKILGSAPLEWSPPNSAGLRIGEHLRPTNEPG